MCRSERNGQITSGTRSATGVLGGDAEHLGRGVHADHPDAGRRDRDGDAPGADGELDHRPSGRERLLDVEVDVLGHRAAPRVVDAGDPVVQRHRGRFCRS